MGGAPSQSTNDSETTGPGCKPIGTTSLQALRQRHNIAREKKEAGTAMNASHSFLPEPVFFFSFPFITEMNVH
jgi:hypothetical protein